MNLVLIDNDPDSADHSQTRQTIVFRCGDGTVEIWLTGMYHRQKKKWEFDTNYQSHSVLKYDDDKQGVFTDLCRRAPEGTDQPNYSGNDA